MRSSISPDAYRGPLTVVSACCSPGLAFAVKRVRAVDPSNAVTASWIPLCRWFSTGLKILGINPQGIRRGAAVVAEPPVCEFGNVSPGALDATNRAVRRGERDDSALCLDGNSDGIDGGHKELQGNRAIGLRSRYRCEKDQRKNREDGGAMKRKWNHCLEKEVCWLFNGALRDVRRLST